MRHAKRRLSRLVAVGMILAVGLGTAAGMWKWRPWGPAAPLLATQTNRLDNPTPSSPATPSAPAPAPAPGKMDKPRTPAPKALDPKPPPPTPAPKAPQPPVVLSGNPLADAKARFDADDLVTARRIISDAMQADRLGADRQACKELMDKVSQQMIFGRRVYKDDPFAVAYVLQPGDRLQKVAANHDINWEFLCRINGITDPKKVRALQTIKAIKGPFHAVITKSKFTMDLYLGAPGGAGSMYVMTYPVGLGKDDSTPAGTWRVAPHSRLKNPTYYSPRGEGIIQSGDPKNPLGPFWIGLVGVEGSAVGKPSYGIHGTIDAASIGKAESLGCIRMRNEDVAMVFELMVEGKSTVVVKD